MIKAVIFDLDNTLYEYESCHNYATDKVYDYCKSFFDNDKEKFYLLLNESKNEIKEQVGKNVAVSHDRVLYFQRMLERVNIKPFLHADIMYDIYWDSFFEKMKLREGVIELFEILRDKKIKIGICSDLTTYLQFKKIKELKLYEYVDQIVTSEEAGKEKPSREMFELIMNKLNVNSSECIYVGDDYKKDIVGATNLNIKAIQIVDDFLQVKNEVEEFL